MNTEAAALGDVLASSPLEPELVKKIRNWLADWEVPADAMQEIETHAKNGAWSNLTDAFFQDLSFGTGGLRGIVGAGTNRMNTTLVKRVAQGLANFISAEFPKDKRKVVIAYDSRLYSKAFAESCAEVLAAAEVQTFLFNQVETTPGLSFAVREIGCCIGLCFTASHNPPEYAGLKVYAPDGAQVVPPLDAKILSAVNAVSNQSEVKSVPLAKARASGLIGNVPAAVQESYYNAVSKLQIFKGQQRTLKVVYTPLHGTGAAPAMRVMTDWGFTHFSIVPEQELPDGHFPTVRKPNPEEPAALEMLFDFARSQGADVGFASDPDSDRLALISHESPEILEIFKDQATKDYVLLNGNQTGALLLSFLLPEWRRCQRLTKHSSVIKTIVTSELHTLICKENDVVIWNTLTGFKWIAAKVREWETTGSANRFVFGTEESFGYMPGDYVRDKDGIAALAMAAEMADSFKKAHMTPCQVLLKLFERHGAWHEDLFTIDLEGKSGQERTAAIMRHFRQNPPTEIAGVSLACVEDYSDNSLRRWSGSSFTSKSPLGDLPASDVLVFRLADGGQISVRPSGTEPKIKFYFSATRPATPNGAAGFINARNATRSYRDAIVALAQATS